MNTPLNTLDTIFITCIGMGFLYMLISALMGGLAHGMGHGGVGHFGDGHAGVGHFEHFGHAGDGSHAHLGHTGDHAHSGGDSEGHWSLASYISPMSVSFFLAGFGAFGLVATRSFGMATTAAVISSMGAGLVISAGTLMLFAKLFIDSQGSSQPTALDLVGCKAEVITSITENGVGAVAYVTRGSRFTAPAKSVSGEIPMGTLVRIRSAFGNTLEVERMDS